MLVAASVAASVAAGALVLASAACSVAVGERFTNISESAAPLFPFGHGLTYTRFAYANLRVAPGSTDAAGTVTVAVDLANEGKRAGTEVVQLYVRDRVATATRPVRELKGFARVTLAAGERRTVELRLVAADLAYFDPERGWTPGDGAFDVWVGADAASGLHATLEVAAPAAR